jgi:serine/threonine protein kinase/Leucine-rich repeat (LRR) protein
MSTPHDNEHDPLAAALASLEEQPTGEAQSTLRRLHAELNTLAEQLRQPAPADPHQGESACDQAVDAIVKLPLKEQGRSAASEDATDPIFLDPGAGPGELGRLDGYKVLRVLGRGGMGMVLEAIDIRLERRVAIKVILPRESSPSLRERFLREAKAVARLRSDHIVTIHQVGEHRGFPYMVMEYLEGRTLEQFLESGQRLTIAQILKVATDIALGLSAAHRCGLIHRDIKPANLWIDRPHGGRIKILDFGLARDVQTDSRLTQGQFIVGTPLYMAPEQAHGSNKLDGRVDLFSLGVVLYRLCTGRLPFTGETAMAVLLASQTEQPPSPKALRADVPEELSQLIMELLAKKPEERPASAQEVLNRLKKIRARLPNSPRAVTQPPKSQPRADEEEEIAELQRGWRWRLPILISTILVGLLATFLVMRQFILRITDREGKSREIVLNPGDKLELLPTTIPATSARSLPSQAAAPVVPLPMTGDVKAAAYVLWVGGQLTIEANGKRWELRPGWEVPTFPFQIVAVNLRNNDKITDEGLKTFASCSALEELRLGFTKITDEGLEAFKNCKKLKVLELDAVRTITDRGLAHFKDCHELTHLNLAGTHVTDAGLEHFSHCKQLESLRLYGARSVTDAGLKHFHHCRQLTELSLSHTQVTDAGLEALSQCEELRLIWLHDLPVTDRILTWLERQPGGDVKLLQTRLSARAYHDLRRARPHWNLEWSEPNHDLAVAVLQLGGSVEVAAPNAEVARPVTHPDELITDYVQVRRLKLEGIRKPLGNFPKLLAKLTHPQFDKVEYVEFSNMPAPDLAYLEGHQALKELRLTRTQMTDADLRRLPALPSLQRLVLDGNDLKSAALYYVVNTQPQLLELSLNLCPNLEPQALAHLAKLTRLHALSLAGSRVTDEALQHLRSMVTLREIDLRNTRVTREGLESLQHALPSCQVRR